MKRSVWFLAALILAVFATLSFFYVHRYATPRAYGIILFVANGYDLSLAQRYRQQAAKRGEEIFLDHFSSVALLSSRGLNDAVPDEAAASTMLASGETVPNGQVGLRQSEGDSVRSLLMSAREAGRTTALVTTSSLTDTTPVAFYSTKRGQPDDHYRNAQELIHEAGIDIILGGGGQYFSPAHPTNEMGRLDGRDLFNEAQERGYTVVRTPRALEDIADWRTWKLFGVFAPDSFPYTTMRRGTSNAPSLAVLVRRAVQLLNKTLNGYFLVVEHNLIAEASAQNLTQLAINEAAALDEAMLVASQYAGEGSLILVTNNYSLGVMDLTQSDLKFPEQPVDPVFDWLSGPGGEPQTAEDRAWMERMKFYGFFPTTFDPVLSPQPAVRFRRRAEVSSTPAWIAARGFGHGHFRGFLEMTQIYDTTRRFF